MKEERQKEQELSSR